MLRNALIDRDELPRLVKLAMRTIEEEIRQGRFPKPRQLSGRRVAWLAADIDAWMEARPASDLPPPPNTGARKTKPAPLALRIAPQAG